MNKQCQKCHKYKPLSEYNKNKCRKDGLQGWCKKCASGNAKKWYVDNKHRLTVKERLTGYNKSKKHQFKRAVDRTKSQSSCCFCGEAEACCLDFHHTGDKDKDVSYFTAVKSVARLCDEISKCICVCSNCHRKIHAGLLDSYGKICLNITEEEFRKLLQEVASETFSG